MNVIYQVRTGPVMVPERLEAMKHGIVYSGSLFYAGWPANKGSWDYGDESVFGITIGIYRQKSITVLSGDHPNDRP